MTETAREQAPSPSESAAHPVASAAPSAAEAPTEPAEPTSTGAGAGSRFEVVLFPDPILRKETRPVTRFDAALREVAEGMLARMFESRGVGLAAPQVGLGERLFVLNPEGDPEHPELSRVLVNPVITARHGKRVKHEEGCLSLPQIYAVIERPERCTVEFQELDGTRKVEEFDGFLARIVQHEYDHLEGVLIVDRMTPADKARHRAALDELRAQYREERG